MKKHIFLFAPSVFFSLFFFSACGLDTYYTLSAPPAVIHTVNYSDSDPAQNYVAFRTAKNDSDSSFRFLGTAVYYRIYASSSVMLNHMSSISSVNTTSDYSAAANRMKGYGYQQLNTSDGSIQPLISAESTEVSIRLTNNHEAVSSGIENTAQITVISKTPRRSLGTNKTFDFGRYYDSAYVTQKDNYAPPVSGDEDFENGDVKDKKYYVNMYAVAVGRDSTYTMYYSNVLHLGTVVINAGVVDN